MSEPQSARVGVVIPVYRAQFLAECLASVWAQSTRPDRVMVVDDGSPDRTLVEAAIAPYAGMVTLLRQPNRGAGAARNRGIVSCDTDLIAFLDADDAWDPTFLRSQLALMASTAGCEAVYANAMIVGDTPLRGTQFMDAAPSEGPATVEALLSQRCTVLTSSVVVRRQRLLDAGLFDESLRRGQDFDLWLRLAAQGLVFTYTRTPLVLRRVHGANLSGDRVTELERAIHVLGKLRDKLALSHAQCRILELRMLTLRAQLATEHGKRMLLSGDVVAARSQFRQAVAAGGGWKAHVMKLALKLAPTMTRQAYMMRVRRGAAV